MRVGFEPTPFRTSDFKVVLRRNSLSWRLRPLGHLTCWKTTVAFSVHNCCAVSTLSDRRRKPGEMVDGGIWRGASQPVGSICWVLTIKIICHRGSGCGSDSPGLVGTGGLDSDRKLPCSVSEYRITGLCIDCD